jgi:hypothetical protein
MDSLRAMLRHADHYGLKYAFVHDPFYDPLLVFSGWRKIETFDSGAITAWVKDDAPPARKVPSDAMPTPMEGLLWGILPIGSSILAILLVILIPDRVAGSTLVTWPARTDERIFAHQVQS